MLAKNFSSNNRFISTIKNFLLYFTIIFFSIFSSIPIKFFSFITIFPNIASVFVFYFIIVKMENINYFAVFILGLFFDIFNNLPIGITSFIWLITSRFISFLRMHLYTPDNFFATFRDFSIFTILNSILQWVIFSIVSRVAFPISNTIIQMLLNIVFFAILYKLLKKIERWFL